MMFEVLVYLFENYYQADAYPDHDTLSRKLHAAGFENEDISEALDWLNGLARFTDNDLPRVLETSASHRAYTTDELAKLTTEGRGFLIFLESARVLSPLLREVILERAMALPDDVVGLEKLKVIALIVLWARRGSVDTLILDELLPDGEKRQMH
jgi:Smg protein